MQSGNPKTRKSEVKSPKDPLCLAKGGTCCARCKLIAKKQANTLEKLTAELEVNQKNMQNR
ncbi:MAG: hypothetical protein AAGD28_14950 [Bacteroidota bacterium]